MVAELQKLAALQQQGILSADEFAAAKAKLLG
ncbi:SHOCT domain-containing protein [Agromyces seonyuensis]